MYDKNICINISYFETEKLYYSEKCVEHKNCKN